MMEKAIIVSADGQKREVYLIGETEKEQLQTDKKKQMKENLYVGYLVVATLAFGLGLLLTIKKLNGK